MNNSVLKIIWNSIAIVGLVLIGIWIYRILADNGGVTITSGKPVLEAIKHVNKQIFVEHYNAVDVMYTEIPQGWLSFLGSVGVKQEIVVLVRGRVPAGFDLQKMREDDVWVSSDGKRAQITLPSPEVFEDNVVIDFENSRILSQSDRCPGFICQNTLVAYQNEVLPEGRKLLIDFAIRNNILEQTAKDGRDYYEQFLKSFGFEEVRVIVSGYGL
ncbi:MAG: DUF4230 domain-containing protein [Anaerolineae bacterium]|nr:DUF4230 domain-containing protein [Anaerolineae bacterium]